MLSLFYRKFTTTISFFNYILLFTISSTLFNWVTITDTNPSMTQRSLKYPLLIISFCFISAKLFAQLSYPGDDPMRADSAKYIVTLKPTENKQLTSHSNLLPSKEDKDSNKSRQNVQLNKNEEKDTRMIF